jgi:hypothetical protein
MKYYIIYQITNIVNGKIYAGAHETSDLADQYMGSGTNILRAIKKYGISNFKKDILFLCENAEQMYKKENEIVNSEFLTRTDVYNIKEGGLGGWSHINNYPSFIEAKRKGGMNSKFFDPQWRATVGYHPGSKEHMDKMRKLAVTEEAIAKKKQTFKLRDHQKGQNNNQYGTVWCVLEDASDINTRQKYKKEQIPEGYITVAEWRDRRKNKHNNAYGRKWYNDGEKNYFLHEEDAVTMSNLRKGRVGILFSSKRIPPE